MADLCAALAPCFSDNNVKISATAASVVELLAASLPEGALRPYADALVVPMTDLLGGAKVCRAVPRSARPPPCSPLSPTAAREP